MKDLRYARTEKLICTAVSELLEKQDIESVSTLEICRRAGVSRNAFYAHYLDKYDLLGKLSAGFMAGMTERIMGIPPALSFSGANRACAEQIVAYFDEHLLQARICMKNDPHFWRSMQAELEKIILRYVPVNDRFYLYAKYSAGALCSCIIQYYSGQIDLPRNAFTQYLAEIAELANAFLQPLLEEADGGAAREEKPIR